MSTEKEIHRCEFIERPNRFLGIVKLDNSIIEVFIPNPGRMYELMVPGKQVFIRVAHSKSRKTAFDMIGVLHDGILVSIDSLLPNRFMKELLKSQEFEPFTEYSTVYPEPRAYEGRFDFLLERNEGIAYIEVKSCTLVIDGRARFPDSPTSRGTRHLRSLIRSLNDGTAERASVVFVIQRPDASSFSPNDETDPKFGEALRECQEQGVEIYALSCMVENWALTLKGTVPVDLDFFVR